MSSAGAAGRADRIPLLVWALGAVFLTVALGAVRLHGAGHVSMDSSAQLYEALTGRSVSWSPPFMSAVLRWLGGGLQATTSFVIACSLLTYGGFALALSGAGRVSRERVAGRRILGALLVLVLALNPLVFLHVGIVWKDVLFATSFAFGAGLLLLATGSSSRVWYVVAAVALLPAVLARQQGLVMIPPLLLACALGAAGVFEGPRDRRAALRTLAWLACFALGTVALNAASRTAIQGSGDKSTSTGFASIQLYDITGMIATGGDVGVAMPPALRSQEFREAVMRSYSDDRIDHVMAEEAVARTLKTLPHDSIRRLWFSFVRENPRRYVDMKARQLAWLFGLRRLDHCLPIHLGVEGNTEYLAAAGVPRGTDAADRELYQWSLKARTLVAYRHWFYAVLLVGAALWLCVRRRQYSVAEQVGLGSIVAGVALFYASFSVTVLACDFRYLYPGLVGVSVLLIFLLSRALLVAKDRS